MLDILFMSYCFAESLAPVLNNTHFAFWFCILAFYSFLLQTALDENNHLKCLIFTVPIKNLSCEKDHSQLRITIFILLHPKTCTMHLR